MCISALFCLKSRNVHLWEYNGGPSSSGSNVKWSGLHEKLFREGSRSNLDAPHYSTDNWMPQWQNSNRLVFIPQSKSTRSANHMGSESESKKSSIIQDFQVFQQTHLRHASEGSHVVSQQTNSNFYFSIRRGRPSRIIGDNKFKVWWSRQFDSNWRHSKWRTPLICDEADI